MPKSQKMQGFIEKNKLLASHPNPDNPLKRGDLVAFMGGYHDHIAMAFNVIGFDVDEDSKHVGIYVDWECYWFPIYQETRHVTLVSDRLEAIAACITAQKLKH